MFEKKWLTYIVLLLVFTISCVSLFPFYSTQQTSIQVVEILQKQTQSKSIVYKLSELLVSLELVEKDIMKSFKVENVNDYIQLKNEIITVAQDYSRYVESTKILQELDEHFNITKKVMKLKANSQDKTYLAEMEEKWIWSLTNLHILIGKQIIKDDALINKKISVLEENQVMEKYLMLFFALFNMLGILLLFFIFRQHILSIRSLNFDLKEKIKQNQSLQTQIVAQEKLIAISRLTSGVAHEIRNPLNFISTSINLLDSFFKSLIGEHRKLITENGTNQSEMEDFESEVDEAKFLINSVKEGSIRADKIVESMSNLNQNKEMAKKDFKAGNIIDKALTIAYKDFSNGGDFKVNIKEPYNKDFILYGDQILLETVFINIFLNAFYYIKEKKDLDPRFEGEISIHVGETGKHNFIRILNNGAIDNLEDVDDFSKLFEPFYTTKDPDKGTGMGLAIVYNLIVEHEGDITISNGNYFEVLIELPKEDV